MHFAPLERRTLWIHSFYKHSVPPGLGDSVLSETFGADGFRL
jgi:hypothetical protein